MTSDINTMRHISVFDPEEFNYPIHIIGAGATGSHVFASLVGLGVTNINVYDYDTVEDHNLANQIYTAEDVGQPKVDSCLRYYFSKTGSENLPTNMVGYNQRVDEHFIRNSRAFNGTPGVVFLMTDTMASRRLIFDELVNRQAAPKPLVIIETRMASTHGAIYTINPYDVAECKEWRSTLVDDSDEDAIELSPCGTALSVGPTASIIANYAVWQMMQFFVDPVGLQPRVDLFLKPTLTLTSSAIAA